MAAEDPLSIVRVFQALPRSARESLSRGTTAWEPRSGTRIFAQGDAADALYAVIGGEGLVRIGAADRRSKSLMFGIFRAGDLFGEVGVLEGETRTADAVTEGRVRLLRIPAAQFLQVMREHPEVALSLCRSLSERLRWTSLLLQDATFEMLEVRLARQLLYLGELAGARSGETVRLAGHFRQSDLADLLGATTRSIITILNSWRERGFVAFHPPTGRLTLLNETALRDLIEPKE